MLNQNGMNINSDNQKPPAPTHEELDSMRKYDPYQLSPFDMEKAEKLRNRLLDEINGNKKNLLKIVNQILPEDYKQRGKGSDVFLAQIEKWLESPEDETLRSVRRYIGEKSIAEIIETQLENLFVQIDKEKSEKSIEPGFVETSVFNNIVHGFQIAREECCIMEISTYSGSGKTTAANHYLKHCQKTEGFNCAVWMITLNESNISNKLICWEIYEAIIGTESMFNNNYPGRSSEFEINERISELCLYKPKGLVIIDEAQHIGRFGEMLRPNGNNIINALRTYCDQGLFAIALLSNGEVYDRTKRSENSTQLSSRIWSFKVNKPTANDIDLIMAAWGVSGKRERELSIKLGTDEKNGCLRNLIRTYRYAKRLYGEINFASMSSVIR